MDFVNLFVSYYNMHKIWRGTCNLKPMWIKFVFITIFHTFNPWIILLSNFYKHNKRSILGNVKSLMTLFSRQVHPLLGTRLNAREFFGAKEEAELVETASWWLKKPPRGFCPSGKNAAPLNGLLWMHSWEMTLSVSSQSHSHVFTLAA